MVKNYMRLVLLDTLAVKKNPKQWHYHYKDLSQITGDAISTKFIKWHHVLQFSIVFHFSTTSEKITIMQISFTDKD